MLDLVGREVRLAARSGETIVGEASGPHQCGASLIIVRGSNGFYGCFTDRYKKAFCHAVDQIYILRIGKITFHRVHHDIRRSAGCLIYRKCVGQFRIHACESGRAQS